MRKLLVFCWLVGMCAGVWAQPQEFHVKNFGKEDDLSIRGVVCALQVNGFIFLGTEKGLLAYDGKHSAHYPIPDEENRGGYYSRVTTLQYTDGVIWVGTKRGIYTFDMQKEKLTKLKVKNLPSFWSVSWMQFDNDGNLWVLSSPGVYIINMKTKVAEKVGEGLVNPNCMLIARNGRVWMADGAGMLYRYDPSDRRFHAYDVRPAGVQKYTDIRTITEMSDGTLALVANRDGVCLFHPDSFTSEMLCTQDDEGMPIMPHTAITPDGTNLWIGSERGIVVCNTETHNVYSIRQVRGDANSIPDNAVHMLYADSEEGVWVGSFFGGISRISLSASNLSVCMPEGGRTGVDVVREICDDAYGHLWAGTEDGGLYLFDRQQKTLRLADIDLNGYPLPFNVQSLLVVGDELWVSTLGNGLYVVDTRQMRVLRCYQATNKTGMGQPLNGITLCYQNGTIFVGSGLGVHTYNPEEDAFNLVAGTDGTRVHHLYADRHGYVWLATFDQGLWKIRQKTDGTWYGERSRFSYPTTTVFTEDSRGRYWVGTDLHGIMGYDDKTGKTHPFDLSDELSHQTVTNIMEDHEQRLWISTFDGLFCYDMDTELVNQFTVRNGLPSDFLNYSSGFVDDDGTVYIGTYKGMVRFNPNTFAFSRELLHPYFLNLYVNGEHVAPGDKTGILTKTLFLTRHINLSYAQNTFSITFAAPTYRMDRVVWYRYRFNPDEPWVVTDRVQTLQLNNLSPGDFEISLQASYDPEKWEGETAVLYVSVAPPAWLSTGAILSYILLIVIVVVGVMSLLRRQTNK